MIFLNFSNLGSCSYKPQLNSLKIPYDTLELDPYLSPFDPYWSPLDPFAVGSCENGIVDSIPILILGNHRFQTFWKGTHVKIESE